MPSEADFPSDLRALEGEYELIRELGQGGMAAVYLARKRISGRLVAIKAIRGRYLDDPDALQRFAREAGTVAGLNHANIVQTESIEQIDDRAIAIIMEHVAGGTVRDRLREHGAFGAEHAESVLRDVASALAYAHRRGIVHRDVKPENVFLDAERGRALLSDFGIARRIDGEAAITLLGAALGTPQYMSPEQIDGGMVDGRSDIYSLGVLGWELLTGRRPWAGESLYGVIYKQKHEELPRITSLRPRVPANLLFAIEGALVKDRERRWQSAERFLEQLTYNPPPVLAQDFPAGAVRADYQQTMLFRPAALAAAATAPADDAPADDGPADVAVEEPAPAVSSALVKVAEEPTAVAVAEGSSPAVTERSQFAGADFRLPDFGSSVETGFEIDRPRSRLVRGLALFAPLAIAGVSLFIVLGGNSGDASQETGGKLTPSNGAILMGGPRTDAAANARPVPALTIDTLQSSDDAAYGSEPAVTGPEAPSAPTNSRASVLASARMPGSPASGAPRSGTETVRRRSAGGSVATPAQSSHPVMSGSGGKTDSARGGLTRAAAERADSAPEPDAGLPPLEDPFRPPTVERPAPAAPAAPPARGRNRDVPVSPTGPVPTPRCRLAATADQRACLAAHVAVGDVAMDRQFNSLVGELRRLAKAPSDEPDPTSVQRIRVEQRAWLSIRNSECRRDPVASEGPFWAPALAQCYNEMSASRAAELAEAVGRLRRR